MMKRRSFLTHISLAASALSLSSLTNTSASAAETSKTGERNSKSAGTKVDAEGSFWKLKGDSIVLEKAKIPSSGHKDHIAMSGRSVDLILEWEVTPRGSFTATRLIRWPMLRTNPNNTHGSFDKRLSDSDEFRPLIGDKQAPLSLGTVEEIAFDGTFAVYSNHSEGLSTKRHIFPGASSPAIIDNITLTNTSKAPLKVTIPEWKRETKSKPEVRGVYVIREFILGEGDHTLAPGEEVSYAVIRTACEEDAPPYCDLPESELAARRAFVKSLDDALILDTPDPIINAMFRFAKLRATESNFATRGGIMHGPGGYNKYLAAIWANDQAEYVCPFFPFLGNPIGNESSINCYRHFARFMNNEFKPIPPSIIAEGIDIWTPGTKERGDMAMIAHGASRFALASANKTWGRELLPLIDWCIEFCHRKRNNEGVVLSELDELEGRFPSGNANLCTNTLYYDGLLHAASLHEAVGDATGAEKASDYRRRAEDLKKAMASYFEGMVEGFDTYKYYENNDVLRSWICMPLVVGMFDRTKGTVDALFSPKLWFGNGMLTASNTKTYWDRSALYAFRGIFFAGEQDRALPKLSDYSRERLLGQHVPYAIEAFPEAGQSHLSAESGLYCRIFTEGLFGIDPEGFRAFSVTPHLPVAWEGASLNRMKAFGTTLSIKTTREKNGIRLSITDVQGAPIYDQTLPEGTKHLVRLA